MVPSVFMMPFPTLFAVWTLGHKVGMFAIDTDLVFVSALLFGRRPVELAGLMALTCVRSCWHPGCAAACTVHVWVPYVFYLPHMLSSAITY